MTYVVLTVILVLVLLNTRASLLVTRSAFDNKSQKSMQLALVWLIPFIGANCHCTRLQGEWLRALFWSTLE